MVNGSPRLVDSHARKARKRRGVVARHRSPNGFVKRSVVLASCLGSRATKSREVVNKIGQRLLDCLCQTFDYGSVFSGCKESELELSAYTDSSFVSAGAKSHGAAVVVYRGSPICWRSSRQALVTLSTAESELVEAVEGALLLKSCKGTIADI